MNKASLGLSVIGSVICGIGSASSASASPLSVMPGVSNGDVHPGTQNRGSLANP
jgi:hypothetical protein